MSTLRTTLSLGAGAVLLAAGAATATAAADTPSAPNYGGGAVVPGGGDYTYPVQREGPTVHEGETTAAPAPTAPNGSPVTVHSEEGLAVSGGQVTYPREGYYHWSFQSEDNSYTGVVLVRVVA
ncbi:MAG: hypothetical protein L0K27_09655 [Corynebacterium nuruki]|nr:hypothetical protein [Corynebacterium nuruki]